MTPARAEPAASPRASQGPLLVDDWQAFYAEHVEFVWRSLRRMGVAPANLDDATQDVFVVVFRQHAEFEGRSSLKTWLYGIAFHVAMRYARSAARAAPDTELSELADARGLNQEDALVRAQAIRTFYAALSKLAPERRALIVMALDEMTAPEIAEITGTPLNTVYSRLRAARLEFEAAVRRLQAQDTWRQP